MKRGLFVILLCLWGVGLSLASGEAILRLSGYYDCSLERAFPSIFVESPMTIHALRPNSSFRHCSYHGDYSGVLYTIDENGDRHVPSSHRAGASGDHQVVLLLGDSFTFGLGVNDEETFAAKLQKLSGDHMGYTVINRGVPGYTIDQELLSLNEFLRTRMKSNSAICAIVLQIYGGNDVHDMSNHKVDANGTGIRTSAYYVDNTFRLNSKAKGVGLVKIFARKLFVYRFIVEDFSHNLRKLKSVLKLAQPGKLMSEEDKPSEDVQWILQNAPLINRYTQLLNQLLSVAKSNRTPVIILFESGPNNPLNEKLVRLIEERPNVQLVKTERFLNSPHYFPLDKHYSVEGHAQIAKQLSRIINCRI